MPLDCSEHRVGGGAACQRCGEATGSGSCGQGGCGYGGSVGQQGAADGVLLGIGFSGSRTRSDLGIMPFWKFGSSVCSVFCAFLETAVCFPYGPDFADIFRRLASYVDRILRGATRAISRCSFR
jgi:hypothetical protein